MYLFFHNFITPKHLKLSILTDFHHISTKILRKSLPAVFSRHSSGIFGRI
jgi:hypothetical protein